MANIKGFAVRGLLKYASEKKPGSVPDIIKALPADLAAPFAQIIVPSAMYRYAMFTALVRVIDRTFGRGDLSLCEDIGEFAARQDIENMFKVMSRVVDARTIYERAQIFWTRYCDTGRFVLPYVNANDAATRIEGFPDIDPAHCRLITGWDRQWGLLTYARTIEVEHNACVSRGQPYCEWKMRWT